MHGIKYTIIDSLGCSFPLDVCDLDTVSHHKLIGGTLIIHALNHTIPPISCNNHLCDELAEFLVMAISTSGPDSDSMTHLCREHCQDLLRLKELEVPYEITH